VKFTALPRSPAGLGEGDEKELGDDRGRGRKDGRKIED